MQDMTGVRRTRELSQLQWQVILKAWKMTARIGLQSWWGSTAWSIGSLLFWALRGRRLNGPNFTWPLMLFAGAVPEAVLHRTGRLYRGRPLDILSREALVETVRPDWRALFPDRNASRSAGAAGPHLDIEAQGSLLA